MNGIWNSWSGPCSNTKTFANFCNCRVVLIHSSQACRCILPVWTQQSALNWIIQYCSCHKLYNLVEEHYAPRKQGKYAQLITNWERCLCGSKSSVVRLFIKQLRRNGTKFWLNTETFRYECIPPTGVCLEQAKLWLSQRQTPESALLCSKRHRRRRRRWQAVWCWYTQTPN